MQEKLCNIHLLFIFTGYKWIELCFNHDNWSSVSFILILAKGKKKKEDKITQEVRLWRTAISWSLVYKVRTCLKKTDDNCIA